jgi:hypothetical protein
MKRKAFLLGALLMGAGSAGFVSAHEAKGGQEVKMQGEILDMSCYMGHEAKGEKHKQCAVDCVKSGSPMGLLTKDGKVYLLVEDHANKAAFSSAKELAGEQVTLSGDLFTRGGMNAVAVESVKKS